MADHFRISRRNVYRDLAILELSGTVWKRLDGRYQPGQRVRHWVKRKRGLSMAAFVSNFKAGTPDRGNRDLVGALEFSSQADDGNVAPIGWISSWTDAERRAMTMIDGARGVCLNPEYLQKRAIIAGQDLSARSRRLCHARLVCWLDD